MKTTVTALFCFLTVLTSAQVRIDSTFAFQTDPAKQYSLYIPSTYDPASPNRLMLGLHPFNTSRWWAESWCDTLMAFAETNGLILACPDGGTDGKIDDDIDTAFTSALLDSMKLWYNVDAEKTYVMGFSWGGQTTYTYGLRHIERFGGMLPIGSAMSGTSMVSSVLSNADSVPVYIVHGNNDNPSSRYTPIRDALISNEAILNSILMSGVGHTIDFPNRNQILTDAFQWIDSANCSLTNTTDTTTPPDTTSIQYLDAGLFQVYPNPSVGRLSISLPPKFTDVLEISIINTSGQLVQRSSSKVLKGKNELHLSTENIPGGWYVIRLSISGKSWTKTILLE